ncbi:MAG: hypothetical protein QOG64_203 [Acidimicrobiaceae bacterium]|nr:hypothetical protein [Acidimicrobiaceae bacterium]
MPDGDTPGGRRGVVAAVLLAALFAGTGVLRHAAPELKALPPWAASANPEDATSTIGSARSFKVGLDLDGDGRQDDATFVGSDEVSADWEVTAFLANGTRATITLPVVYNVAAWPVDVNDDDRDELIVRTGGNTWTTGALLVLDHGALVTAQRSDASDFFGWNAHSMCCPAGTADVACGPAAGGVAGLVITSSQLVSPAWDGRWPITDANAAAAFEAHPPRRAWERTIYRLDGATLVAVHGDRGVIVDDQPDPPGVPLHNTLDCDAAQADA